MALVAKNPPANAGDLRELSLIPGSGRSLEEGMAPHPSILAWRIPWTEEPVTHNRTRLKRLSTHSLYSQFKRPRCEIR